MASNFKFTDTNNWSLIDRGSIFEAVMPYVGQRPLEFFIPDKKSPHTGKSKRGITVAFNSEFAKSDEKYDIVLGYKTEKFLL